MICLLVATARAADYSVSDDYGVGTSNVTIFQGIAGKLPYGTHYVYWRDGQYAYRLAYGEDLSLSGGLFVGSDVAVVTYQTYSGYGTQATFVQSQESDFSLNAGSFLVWSDLGGYPTLYERGVKDYVFAACFGLAVCFVFSLVKSIFRSLRR